MLLQIYAVNDSSRKGALTHLAVVFLEEALRGLAVLENGEASPDMSRTNTTQRETNRAGE